MQPKTSYWNGKNADDLVTFFGEWLIYDPLPDNPGKHVRLLDALSIPSGVPNRCRSFSTRSDPTPGIILRTTQCSRFSCESFTTVGSLKPLHHSRLPSSFPHIMCHSPAFTGAGSAKLVPAKAGSRNPFLHTCHSNARLRKGNPLFSQAQAPAGIHYILIHYSTKNKQKLCLLKAFGAVKKRPKTQGYVSKGRGLQIKID